MKKKRITAIILTAALVLAFGAADVFAAGLFDSKKKTQETDNGDSIDEIVDYWYMNGDPESDCLYLGPYYTFELTSDGETQYGIYSYDEGVITLSIGEDEEQLNCTVNDTLVLPYDDSVEFVRGAYCGGRTPFGYVKNELDRDVEFLVMDENNTKVRDYDLACGASYPNHMGYLDWIPGAVTVGSGDGSYMVARNVSDEWAAFPGSDEEFVKDYKESFTKGDFDLLFGEPDDELFGKNVTGGENGNFQAGLITNIWNEEHDMQVKICLYQVENKGTGSMDHIMKTVFAPYGDDAAMKTMWQDVISYCCWRGKK